jgi:hypothetical protein
LTERNHDRTATQQRQPDHERVPVAAQFKAAQPAREATRQRPPTTSESLVAGFLTSRDNQHSGAPAARTHREPITFGAALVVLGATSEVRLTKCTSSGS